MTLHAEGWTMGERYEYKFRIDAFTPASMPMVHLAEYMAALAALLGHEERVHFVRLEEGSTVLVQEIEQEAAPKVRERIESVRRGDGPANALKAFHNIDRALALDNAVGVLCGPAGAEMIRFPGRERPKPVVYSSFRQQGSLDGELVRIGGKDQTVHATLMEGDVARRCEMTRDMARDLARHLFGDPLRVFGEGRWRRMPDGKWELEQFTVSHFEVLDDASLPDVVARLRAIEGSDWKRVDDPFSELRRIRHGPDGTY
jgi:hypothetical protein